MNKKQLVLFPLGSISDAEKERMAESGFLAIECDNPQQVSVVIPGAPLASADDLLLAAMQALALNSPSALHHRSAFFEELMSRIQANGSRKSPRPTK